VSRIVDRRTRSVLGLTKDGTLTEYDLDTGVVIRSGKLNLPPALNYGIGVTDERILIYYAGSEMIEPKTVTLDREAFTPRPFERFAEPSKGRYDCGPVVCEWGFDGPSVSVLDRSTGRKLWETRRGAGLIATPAGLFAYPVFEATSAGPPELLDPITGRVIASLNGWQHVDVTDDQYNRTAPVLLRQVHKTGAQGRTFIGGFDRTGLRVLGSLPYIIYSCRYSEWKLACVSGDRHLLVIEVQYGRW
jgi:hypothetical protein